MAIPEGAIRYNTDSNKMEVWIGDKWMQVAVSSPNLDGGVRAVFALGRVSAPNFSNIIEFVTTSTYGNSADFGDLTDPRGMGGAFSSSVFGYFNGGQSSGGTSPINRSDKITIASTVNATDSGDLQSNHMASVGLSNATRGIDAGGFNPSKTDQIGYITMSSGGDFVDFGNLLANNAALGAVASPTRGIMTGGRVSDPAGFTNVMQYITIGTLGNTQDFGDLTVAQAYQTGCSNATRGVTSGGYSPSPSSYTTTSLVESMQIATLGGAIDYADLVAATNTMRAASTPTRGFFAGGSTGSQTNTIQFVSFQTHGNAVDFGDLQNTADELQGGCSNGHGGL